MIHNYELGVHDGLGELSRIRDPWESRQGVQYPSLPHLKVNPMKTPALLVSWLAVAAALAWAPAPARAETAWGSTTSAPAGTRADMFATTAASGTDVWAVGGYNPGEPPTAVLTQPYAQHWDGAAWAATPVPLVPTYATQSARLSAVASIAGSSHAWAVGHVDDVGSLASQTLTYRWNGAQWARLPSPNPGGAELGNQLLALASADDGRAWAAGNFGYPAHSLLLQWDGSAWVQVPVPDIGGLVALGWDGSQLWAASSARVLRFDGRRWKELPAPQAGGDATLLLSGLAHALSGLWIVGTRVVPYNEGYLYFPYAARWQGAGWQALVSIPAGSGLTAVAAHGATVQATSYPGDVVTLKPSGATRAVTPTSGPVGLNAISLDADGHAWAVGTRYGGSTPAPALYNAPGIAQGGVRVTTGFSGATVSWIGPVNGSGLADVFGEFATGGLPAGAYQIVASGGGCSPGVASAKVRAGKVAAAAAPVHC
jgi:hypothetical protein